MKCLGIVWIAIVTLAQVKHIKGQGQCVANVWAGISTTVTGVATGSPPGGYNTVILYGQGSVNCYGVVAEWRALVPGGCSSISVSFGIWRVLTAGSNYELVGFNDLIVADCVNLGRIGLGMQISLRIPESARIPIEDTDVIGWFYRGGGRSLYATTRDGPRGAIMYNNCNGRSPGLPCGRATSSSVDYQLKARLEPGPPPTIDNLDSSVDIYEGEAAVTRIYTVLASHPSSQARLRTGGLVVDQDKAIRFTFASSSLTEFTYTPEPKNIGTLYVDTAVSFDYELQTRYLLTVSVTAMAQTASGTLTVNILDKNEEHTLLNLPASTSASARDPLCQTAPIYTVTYADVDNPATFPAKKFYIVSSTPVPPAGSNLPFTINEDTGEVFCTSELETWTTAQGTSYDLRIQVSDGMHTVPGILTVDIKPTHDPPVIDNLPATHQVLEDVPVPSVIYRVAASGPFPSDIRLSIEDVAPRNYFNYFSIDAITGDLSFSSAAVLDYNIQRPTPSFTVTLGVRDNLQQGIARDLRVNLIWVNQKPEYSPDEYFVTIPEQCNLDARCTSPPFEWPVPNLALNVIDRDVDNSLPLGNPDFLACGILPSFGSGFFKYPSATSPNDCRTLYQQVSVDIDESPENRQINLTVWTKDRQGVNNNEKGDVAHIYITITDINDNSPVFINVPAGSPPYTATIPENTPGGLSLFTVTATDKDSGVFGKVTYSLRDETSCDTPPPLVPTDATEHFEVDEQTGVVQTKQFVNYEAINPKTICFSLRATDGGGRSSSIQASVTITNVNDIRPVWHCDNGTLRTFNDEYVSGSPCFYNDELRSDTLLGYQVLTILSTDSDSPNSDITYQLLQPERYFSLRATTGEVKVKDYLDTYVKHILYCYSRDNGSPTSLQSQPHLRVRIDTYDAKRQLVDIVIEMQETEFDQTQQDVFLAELRKVLDPWFPKIEIVGSYKDKTEVAIYALKDNSTYDEENLNKAKQFVDRDELLKVLRKDLFGTPKDTLKTPEFAPFGVILVEPTYPIWIIDTIPGIVTLAIICLVFLILLLALILGLCSRYEKCCFKKKPKHTNRNWPDEKKPKEEEYDRLSNHSSERPPPRKRLDSVDTIHSLIYNPR